MITPQDVNQYNRRLGGFGRDAVSDVGVETSEYTRNIMHQKSDIENNMLEVMDVVSVAERRISAHILKDDVGVQRNMMIGRTKPWWIFAKHIPNHPKHVDHGSFPLMGI